MSLVRSFLWPLRIVPAACLVAAISGCNSSATDAEGVADEPTAARSTSETVDVQSLTAKDAPATGEAIFPERSGPEVTMVKTDTATVNYPGGKPYVVRSVKVYSDNSLVSHGRYVSYHPNGQKLEEGEYVDGKKTGPWQTWWDNGREAKTESYVDGELDGQWTLYNRDGAKEREAAYKNGKRHGKWVFYFEDGKVEREENYQDGRPHGAIVYWFPSGQKATETNWNEGKPEGVQSQWYPSGQLYKQTEYKNGKLSGKATTWDEKGAKTEELEFVDGNRVQSTETAKATP